MLNETCLTSNCGCVIMGSRDGSRKTCVLCGDVNAAPEAVPNGVQFRDVEEDEIAALVDREASRLRARIQDDESEVPESVPAAVAAPARATPAQQDPSALMGTLMLQGWTMLGDVCGACNQVPLMRKNTELRCVACGPIRIAAPSATPAVTTARAAAPVAAPTPAPAPAAAPAPPTAAPVAASSPLPTQPTAAPALTPTAPPSFTTTYVSAFPGLDHTVNVAHDRIRALTDTLAQTTDPRTILDTTTAIRGLMDLISVTRSHQQLYFVSAPPPRSVQFTPYASTGATTAYAEAMVASGTMSGQRQ
ncbi:hypothetical protein AMAG_12105 [Allomyces macrogynus ATCC 38327]|uniref:Uncharacterized protein n=1 Tax=Allomyces macrogynus (strain ATCC 38327) TaxID=578462 RepID=A0A0L0SWV1_ALLM3|nr:hypothetical protein AMAG_12105 [Allomyces macrogynus ATCC 38327]|eukprot:KNE67028.1 hypothetical protein AMAG_12105 [Allomyces macrogynus ATCC 38327]